MATRGLNTAGELKRSQAFTNASTTDEWESSGSTARHLGLAGQLADPIVPVPES